MKSLQITAFSFCLFLICFNGSCEKNDSVTGTNLPDVNFFGSITDVDDKQRDVENITITGHYKNIRVFPKPHDVTKFSSDNYEKIDLAEIKEVRPNPAEKFKQDGTEYIEIKVIRTDGQTDLYMIARNNYVKADRHPESGPITKIVTMDQLKSLKINGYKRAEKKENSQD